MTTVSNTVETADGFEPYEAACWCEAELLVCCLVHVQTRSVGSRFNSRLSLPHNCTSFQQQIVFNVASCCLVPRIACYRGTSAAGEVRAWVRGRRAHSESSGGRTTELVLLMSCCAGSSTPHTCSSMPTQSTTWCSRQQCILTLLRHQHPCSPAGARRRPPATTITTKAAAVCIQHERSCCLTADPNQQQPRPPGL